MGRNEALESHDNALEIDKELNNTVQLAKDYYNMFGNFQDKQGSSISDIRPKGNHIM